MSETPQGYEATIGIEVHVQLGTKTKLFSSCPIDPDAPPNTNVCEVSSGQPGALPSLNRKAVEYAVMAALATNSEIREKSVFARKNYFYPDLPKGYQISQYDEPLCENGNIKIETEKGEKEIRVHRIHMEEDAGKLIHEKDGSLVDLNRAGVPLIEIVSEPDMNRAEEAVAYLKKLHAIVTYLGISDGNMQKGNFRCDANVSVKPKGQKELGIRTELKNLNSFRFIEKAILFEIERQVNVIESGDKVVQETRGFDSSKGTTYSMRSKEDAHDYRYFPDPDLIELIVDEKFIKGLKEKLPELPDEMKNRLMKEFSLPAYDAGVITSSKPLALYFEKVVSHFSKKPDAKTVKLVSNWMMTELMRELNERDLEPEASQIQPDRLAQLVELIQNNTISGKIAKKVFEKMWEDPAQPREIVEKLGLSQISDSSALEGMVDEVLNDNPDQVQAYLGGKEKLLGFFVGQIMKKSKGKANPGMVNQILKEKLKKS
jgi:aspartyl-tRNA(Asn)/glutamyl-tRNA(Gln) amidotransferase subunit B